MPKITSLADAGSNKENYAPNNATRQKKSVLAISHYSDEEGGGAAASSKRSKSSSSAKGTQGRARQQDSADLMDHDDDDDHHHQYRQRKRQQQASSSHDVAYKKSKVNGSDRHHITAEGEDGKSSSSRERMLEEKLALLTAERDQVQSQFDELRELRQTGPERILQEWRKAAERRDAQAEEYISKLRNQIRSLEAKRDGGGAATSSSSDGAFLRGAISSREEDAQGRSDKMKEEIQHLKQELASANLALRNQRSGPSTQAAAGAAASSSASAVGYGDEKAIRRLYEDLTGLFISRVEPAVNREKDHYRCFHAIFASEGYYNLEMKLEESESSLPANEGHPDRQDLVYVPAMNPDRDAEIIASGRLPSYLTESLRFERSTAVRFMSTLHKRLDKGSKR